MMKRTPNHNHNHNHNRNVVNGKAAQSSSTTSFSSSSSAATGDEPFDWEMRPGGMLVQKRTDKSESPAPILRLRVAFGAVRFEIPISSQATFGELKRALTAETGLEAAEQKVIYRGRERENGEYLEGCGVKNRSKVVLVEDPASIERRYTETKRNAKMQTAHRAISAVSMELDKLADQVSVMEESISNGIKVPEIQITTLIEMLMMQAIKLDTIAAEGAASTQKILQGKRVQKCVEMLDVLKVRNAGVEVVKPVIVTTKWETFDHWPSLIDL
ncbi:BAG family molecular chaperone regulator 3-like [Cucurbita moschata]|uniref:BAG family molecular chaperone regulator 3-like n=1 Tax=Cucurbita moschata TaxID=3662 RepID=A0A6J1ELJ0_CUCMO|nr:BAG family molecular chaperone regulator 3-like [Cucurbita moschata]